MDLSHTPEQDAFRTELRAWLTRNVPSPPLPAPGDRESFDSHRAWERSLSAAGYGGLAWPQEYGGRGADVVHQAIFEEEYILAGGPERITVLGQKLMAPTLWRHGSDEQKRRWLPGILSAEVIWSQGYSEPEAGSDLAAIRTKAARDGDELVVNGQKIWTSYGAFADWIFALVRTDPEAERHRGITFVAIDMATPGVEARPIVQLDGHAGFAEVFFTDVRVPVGNIVGVIDDGWNVAMTALEAERNSPARAPARYRRDLETLIGWVRALGTDADPLVRDRIAALYAEAETYRLSSLHILARLERGEDLGAGASITKLQWSELERRIAEAAHDLLGPHADVLGTGVVDDPGAWQNQYWYGRASTIWAGTSEIQRNIIAERILGLPR